MNNSDKINHIVFCWLKNSNDNELASKLIKESYNLQKIPGVVQFNAGKPIKSQRDIVDDSFDFAIYMTFRSKEDMGAYIKHPTHQRFVNEKLKPVLKKILVYDF